MLSNFLHAVIYNEQEKFYLKNILIPFYLRPLVHILHSTRSSLVPRSTPIFELIFLPVPLQAGKLSGHLEANQAGCGS